MIILWFRVRLWVALLLWRVYRFYMRARAYFEIRQREREILYGKRGGKTPVGIIQSEGLG